LNNNEAGVPAFPRATLVGGSWVEGMTVRIGKFAFGKTSRRGHFVGSASIPIFP
jgi:hypothetical protein